VYGKIFDSIYNGTLYGNWEALVTMQQFIVLADADGVVDMTPMAISARTSIPREIIEKGIDILGKPDKYSRTPGSDGRRIELIDEHRPWGWILVNYEHYKALRDADTVRAQTRERVRKHRESKKKQDVTHGNAPKRHIDIDIPIDIEKRGQKRCPPSYLPSKELLDSLFAETRFDATDFVVLLREMKDHEFKDAKKDWDAVFRNWVRRSAKWAKENPHKKLSYAQKLKQDLDAANK